MPENPTASDAPAASAHSPTLARTMGLWSLAIYGVGDMLGSGIYALIGKAAGIMGNAIWLAFVTSMVAALLTALSYACIGSRYPRAAGAAYVTHRAFGRPFLSYVIGLAVMASGLTSMATATQAFGRYFRELVPNTPLPLLMIGFILVLSFINFRGMRESTWLNLVCTAVEVGGLLFIIAIGLRFWGDVNYFEVPTNGGGGSGLTAGLVLNGAVLTFFSFVGFEDLLNVAEEVKEPQRTLPRGLLLAMVIVTVVYISVSISAISTVPYAVLAKSEGPLVEVVRRGAPWLHPSVFSFISMFAIANTALLNYIMGSRLAYGMARQGLLPGIIGRVHATRRTPHVAIALLMLVVLALAFSGDIKDLGKATAALLLGCFTVVNLALVVLKLRPGEPRGHFEVPIVVPMLGSATCLLLLVNTQWAELKIVGILLAGITAMYLALRPKVAPETME